MNRRTNRKTHTRALILESLDPRLCLAAGIGSAGLGEIHFENASVRISHWHNASSPHDVNQDRSVTPADALLVVNTLNARGARTLSGAEGETTAQVDVNDDSQVTPADCLAVVNQLNQESVGGATADDGKSDAPSIDEVSIDDGNGDDGTADDGTADDGTVDDGTTDDVPTDREGCDGPTSSRIEDLFTRADANEDGVLTEDELPARLWERLSGADTDEDGSITLDELTAFMPDRDPHGRPHDGHGDGDDLDRFDENEDGLLTEDELPEEVWEHISPADTDGDGAISAEELAAYRPTPPSREEFFDRLDENDDGLLTEDELPARLWERLSGADTDEDGSITLDELISFKPDRGPHRSPHDGNCDGDLLARFDQDDDGFLAEDEVPEELWERISPADSDGDGYISSEELAAFRPEHPPRESIAPTDLASASREYALPERGPAPHRRSGPNAMVPFGGSGRRV